MTTTTSSGLKMPRIELRSASGQKPPINLGQVDLGMADGNADAVQIVITNRDTLDLSEVRVSVEGTGARAVQLARDADGIPGEWVSGEIIARVGILPPNRSCEFWAKAVKSEDIAVGNQRFEFVVNTVVVMPEG